MATAHLSVFLRRLTWDMVAETLVDQSDGQLVEQFLARRDEAAFVTLVRRHGPMVYRVCWRVCQQEQDAEDAFQATFLLLAEKLHTVRKHDSLASWLHGVAHRVALKAKAQALLRRRHEEQASVSQPVPPDAVTWGELRMALDAELAQLPDKWRLPLILCYLEGRTQDEAAGHFGWSRTTLQRRLAEARAALGRRLSRRGVIWPAALSAVLLSDCVAPAALAPGLVSSTVEAAARVAAGRAAISAVSVKVAALTEGVLKTMLPSKLKIAMAVLLAVAALSGAAGLIYQTQAAERPKALTATEKADDKEKQPAEKKDQDIKEDEAKQLKALEGEWEVIALTENGGEVPADELKGKRWTFKGAELYYGGDKPSCKVKIDPSKNPKHIDLFALRLPNKGKTQQGIYKLEKERLIFCVRRYDEGRPTEFTAEKGSDQGMITLEKVKK
jgi:RNA polymerase sigma factor (sigma-70 family)